jgi:predicted O-linked N-acetylglucosamine transferase (SPINDLY family)
MSDQRLRVGYVSPDFRQHPLIRYFEPVLANHDPARVEAICYAAVARPDAVTARLQKLAHGWRWITRMTDAEAAQCIHEDRIDILVDLTGHSSNNRLGILALRPASVQATWLGYLNTTGLDTVAYRLTDDFLDPPGQPIRDTEELLRLPGGMCCFAPPLDAPVVVPLPALRKGHLTFGCLQQLFKLNARVFDLWSDVLKALPDAKLLILRDSLTTTAQDRLRRQFSKRGIGEDRLDLRQGPRTEVYLDVYNEIDVCLDTFPCTGGVTTCESLWMGVPVLTLCGARPLGRNSAALLNRVGLKEWIVLTPEEYLTVARSLSGGLEQLAQLREGLRDHVRATLCDGKAFTRQLEDVYLKICRR